MELEYEGHVSSKSENDEESLYESSLLLGENEPTVSIPITASRVQTVNCKHGRPTVGSPEELVEAESYTEPDKWEESGNEDTVVVEAYPTVDCSNSKESVVQSLEESTGDTHQERSCGLEPSRKDVSKYSSSCLGDFSGLCSIIQKESNRQALLLLCEVLGVDSNNITDISSLKERLLSVSIRQPLDAFNLQRVESILKQWDCKRITRLANLLQIREKEENELVESIMQRLDNLERLTEEENDDWPKKRQKRVQ